MDGLNIDKSNMNSGIIVGLDITDNGFGFTTNISTALDYANMELQEIEDKLTENIDTIKRLTPNCDKTDYILAASSGAICGMVDIFLVGKPGESPIGDITDKWFENRTKDFARLSGWNDKKDDSASSAIKYLEKKFKVPYDQRGAGDVASQIFDLNPKNHHFKSLGHNPTILGLFFSILDQFNNTSHFVSNGELISLQEADGSFELCGNNIPSRLFCGFVNWYGHIISDMSGSSGSSGRGMGIPSPLWSWTNDIIAIKSKLHIPVTEFDKSLNNLALQLYNKGYDARFQTAQAIPVVLNELVVRLIYSIRRMIQFYTNTKKEERSFKLLWKQCEPFSNATVKRMLTVAHGTFCLIDISDATIHSGGKDITEFVMRLNIVGVGRFTISLYGEANRVLKRHKVQKEVYFLKSEKMIIEDYIEGLKSLSEIYDDKELLTFIDDLKNSEIYKNGFEKTVLLAEKRGVEKEKILKNKNEIDEYFRGGNL